MIVEQAHNIDEKNKEQTDSNARKLVFQKKLHYW